MSFPGTVSTAAASRLMVAIAVGALTTAGAAAGAGRRSRAESKATPRAGGRPNSGADDKAKTTSYGFRSSRAARPTSFG
jgi:hypothetical protein